MRHSRQYDFQGHPRSGSKWGDDLSPLSGLFFSKWRPLPSWISEILKFHWLTGSRGRHIIVPYFIKICQSIAGISWFFAFTRWRPPLSWISEFSNFIGWRVLGFWGGCKMHHHAILHQNLSNGFWDITIFWFFKVTVAAILDFRNSQILLAEGVQSIQMHHHDNYIHLFNGLFSRTAWESWHQKSRTILVKPIWIYWSKR